ncbi:MAG: hypothetical protein U1E40_12315 [Amaricoccus sp.]
MARARTRGFWRGFLTGIGLAALAGLAAAWFLPPVPATPPEVTPGSLTAPQPPEQPQAVSEPGPPQAQGSLMPPPAPGPLIAVSPGQEVAPGQPGSSSLVPQQ